MDSKDFLEQLQLKYPLFVAPMAGGPSSVELVVETAKAGALGGIGGAYSAAPEIENFVQKVRTQTSKPIAINLFIPHPIPEISAQQISKAKAATLKYRQELGLSEPILGPPYEENFELQFEMVLKLKPQVLSFVFGLLKPECIQAARKEKIFLIGTATTLEEALALQDSNVDAITLQGFEAGGHRGIFNAYSPDMEISLWDLLAQCKGPVKVPLLAAGGIMNAVDIKKALAAGAHAVQMGTAFLACKEAGTLRPYRDALLSTTDRQTKTSRAFSGRWARGIENRLMMEMDSQSEAILPFPIQNKFTRDIRSASAKSGSSEFLSLWSGTGKGELWTGSASGLIHDLFAGL